MDRPHHDEPLPEFEPAGRRLPAPLETRLVRVGFTLIALFVVYDTMIDLRPGVARSDHLSALLVPLALLASVGWAWPRLTAGWRALLLVAAGAASVAGGVASSGDGAVAPLLLVVPGVAMTVASPVVAFRGRRRDGRVPARRLLAGVGTVLWLWWVVVPLAMAVVATHRPADEVERYLIGPRQRDVTITTPDGLRLSAAYVPSRNGAAVITFPTKAWTATESRLLAHAGFGVLALEMRGYGGSEGDVNRFGWDSVADVDAAVEYLRGEGIERIGGLGISVGGEVLIDAAATNRDLLAVVSEGAGERSIRETLVHGPAAALVLPQAAVQTAALALLTGDAPPPSLERQVARISPRAVFLINAENGAGGEQLNTDFFAAAGAPKRFWTVPGAGHTEGLAARPAEYASRVVTFFERFLQPAAASDAE